MDNSKDLRFDGEDNDLNIRYDDPLDRFDAQTDENVYEDDDDSYYDDYVDDYDDDGQPDEYTEWQDYMGGDDNWRDYDSCDW
jgi:hypothetical protein